MSSASDFMSASSRAPISPRVESLSDSAEKTMSDVASAARVPLDRDLAPRRDGCDEDAHAESLRYPRGAAAQFAQPTRRRRGRRARGSGGKTP